MCINLSLATCTEQARKGVDNNTHTRNEKFSERVIRLQFIFIKSFHCSQLE